MTAAGPRLIQTLQDKSVFPHPVRAFELIETHISWVLLTGDYAYKIKKPVDLGFLDFSTLEKRRFYCHEELRLNRRLASQLYLEVITITGPVEHPALNGSGPILEYAVKMVQFPQEAQLDRVLARGELNNRHIDALARNIAAFHERIPTAGTESPMGDLRHVEQPVLDNYSQIEDRLSDRSHRALLERLRTWSIETLRRRRGAFEGRKKGGYVRECHGDMHLRNMALIDGDVVLFDCIEFSDTLRWVDVMSDIAFLDMDLEDRGKPAFARRFLNAYLQRTGDYGGLEVLRYYQVYRAAVRANVASIRLGQVDLAEGERRRVYEDFLGYLHLADGYTKVETPLLLITHGVSGSGKTTYTGELIEALGAIRIRSDVERKRLFGLSFEAQERDAVDQGIYTAAASERTYRRLAKLAEGLLRAGYRVIVDATFLSRQWRDEFKQLASRVDVPFSIVDFRGSAATLRRRVSARERARDDASDAGLAVLQEQLDNYRPLAAEERVYTVAVDTDAPVATKRLGAELLEKAVQYARSAR